MMKTGFGLWLPVAVIVAGFSACQRDTPVDKAGSQSPRPAETVERAVQQTVDEIKGPMDKARSVEGTLEQAAERTAEQEAGATR